MTRKHYTYVIKFIEQRSVLTVCILAFFLINIFIDNRPLLFDLDKIVGLILSLSGIAILFSFFHINQSFFTKQTRLGRVLQFIGRRTLDIYLIHYFLLPEQMMQVTDVFRVHSVPIIEAACSFVVASIIIAMCLLTSETIRLSPFLAHWLFGVSPKKN